MLLALGRLRQEDHKFEINLVYIMRLFKKVAVNITGNFGPE